MQTRTQNPTGTKRLTEPAVTQKQAMQKMPESLTRQKVLQKTENLRSPQTQKALTEPEMLTTEEKWERAGLTDTFIFYKVMTENPDTCRRLLELLLHVKIEKIEILGEKSLGIDTESKGIRLDVYVKDENRTFDVEMQVKDTGELPERSRYYQGVMDVDMLKSGEPYRALKESHVIFICLKDIFKQGLAHYTFENLCIQNPRIRLGDRSLKHFFVAENYDRIESDKELKAFLKMLMTGRTEDSYTQELELCTAKAKQNALTRRQYMDWARELNYEKERGYSIGYDNGYGTGLKSAKLEDAANLLRANLGSLQQISDVTGLSLAEVEEIKNSLVCAK